MRVPHLLLTYDFPPMRGGIARYMAELALRYEPGRLIVSTGRQEGGAAADARFPNPVDRLPLDARRMRTADGLVRWSRRVMRLTREHGATFAWCGNVRPAAYPAAWAHWRAGLPFGVILHGSDVLWLLRHARRSARKRLVYRALLGRAAVFAANSHWTRDRMANVLDELSVRVPDDRLRVVPLGTDPTVFHPGVSTAAVRERYALPEGRWLVSMARLAQWQKGIDTGIELLGALRGEFPDLRYLVLVVGSMDDRPRFEALAERCGVGDRVHFLGGLPDADLPALLGLGDIFLGLSRTAEGWQEGFGIALVEAEACGLPVVAGRSGGIPDAVRDGETGLLVDATSAAEPTAAVRALLDDPARARAMGAAGRALVERSLNWNRVAADLTALGDEFGRVAARA